MLKLAGGKTLSCACDDGMYIVHNRVVLASLPGKKNEHDLD